MVHYSSDLLDARFAALADATRRGVLVTIGRGDVSISDLADHFDMTLTGMKKHVDILERAGLIATEKIGRVRFCRPGAAGLDDVADWIGQYHALWSARFDALDRVLETLKQEDRQDG